MPARWLLVISLALVLPRPAGAASAPLSAFRQASTTWHGLVLSLRVSGSSFPKNALVRATVTLTNRSTQTKRALTGSCEAAHGTLSARVLLQSRAPAPLPQALASPQTCGPPPMVTSIRPSGRLSRQLFLVLTGSIVQGSVLVYPNAAARLLTVTLHLPLSDEPAPQLVLDTSSSPYGTVRPRTPVHGPLRYRSWTGCYWLSTPGSHGKPTFDGGSVDSVGWIAVRGNRITPQSGTGCSSWEWHGVAGWLNHPAARVDYKSGWSPFTGPSSTAKSAT